MLVIIIEQYCGIIEVQFEVIIIWGPRKIYLAQQASIKRILANIANTQRRHLQRQINNAWNESM